jgi:hypothetical protein
VPEASSDAGSDAAPPEASSALATNVAPRAIAADDAGVYVLMSDSLVAFPPDGGSATTLTSGFAAGSRLALDATHVYFLTDSSVSRVPRSGGTSETLAAGLSNPSGLAVDDGNVYFTEPGSSDPSQPADGRVTAVTLADGSLHTLAEGQRLPAAVVVDADAAYFASLGFYPSYISPSENGSISKVPKAGGALTPLLTDLSLPDALAIVDGTLFWGEWFTYCVDVSCGDGALGSLPLAGGFPTALAAHAGWANDIAVDATHVYWANIGNTMNTSYSPGQVERVLRSGGSPEILASAEPQPFGIAINSEHVYAPSLASGGTDGAVWMLPK